MHQPGLTHFLMSLKCLLVYYILATFTEFLLAKLQTFFPDRECKLLQKFGQVLSTLVWQLKPNVTVWGKVNLLAGPVLREQVSHKAWEAEQLQER